MSKKTEYEQVKNPDDNKILMTDPGYYFLDVSIKSTSDALSFSSFNRVMLLALFNLNKTIDVLTRKFSVSFTENRVDISVIVNDNVNVNERIAWMKKSVMEIPWRKQPIATIRKPLLKKVLFLTSNLFMSKTTQEHLWHGVPKILISRIRSTLNSIG